MMQNITFNGFLPFHRLDDAGFRLLPFLVGIFQPPLQALLGTRYNSATKREAVMPFFRYARDYDGNWLAEPLWPSAATPIVQVAVLFLGLHLLRRRRRTGFDRCARPG
jgi:hypothetical protein